VLKQKPSDNQWEFFPVKLGESLPMPMIETTIQAGFPSPADDYLDTGIDLNKELIRHPSATFYIRVRGDSMRGMGIDEGDLLIVDRSLEAENGRVAVCCLNGAFTVKRLLIEPHVCWLMPANERYRPIKVTQEDDFLVWGIVIHIIKSL